MQYELINGKWVESKDCSFQCPGCGNGSFLIETISGLPQIICPKCDENVTDAVKHLAKKMRGSHETQ